MKAEPLYLEAVARMKAALGAESYRQEHSPHGIRLLLPSYSYEALLRQVLFPFPAGDPFKNVHNPNGT